MEDEDCTDYDTGILFGAKKNDEFHVDLSEEATLDEDGDEMEVFFDAMA